MAKSAMFRFVLFLEYSEERFRLVALKAAGSQIHRKQTTEEGPRAVSHAVCGGVHSSDVTLPSCYRACDLRVI